MYRKGNIMKVKNVSLENKVILVTGAAGFIGSNLVMELLREVHPVHIVGIDNMNEYYDVSIKEYRLNQIEELVGKQESSTLSSVAYGTFLLLPYTEEDEA